METSVSIDRFLDYFEHLEDPRRDHPTKIHPLDSIVTVVFLGVLGGADGWVQIEQWAKANKDWLRSVLELPEGVPSHDTLGRVFGMLDHGQFQRAFRKWAADLARLNDELIALDGKTLCGSADGDEDPVHVINAWASENELVMAQLKVADDTNEISGFERAVRLLDVQGCVVTVDAMGCQTDIAQTIDNRNGDYLLRVRDNQQNLRTQIDEYFEWALDEDRPADQSADYAYVESTDGGHGRIETRKCWCSEQITDLEPLSGWPGVEGIVRVDSTREYPDQDKPAETQTKYYITSCSASSEADARHLLETSRSHWEVENKVHWVLDVAMDEDRNQTRNGQAAENLSVVRKFAMNVLREDDSLDVGVETKRLRAAGDHDYMLELLEGI